MERLTEAKGGQPSGAAGGAGGRKPAGTVPAAPAQAVPTADVVFTPGDLTVTVPIGTTLLDAAAAAGVELELDAPCGGQGRCGRCKVHVERGNVRRREHYRLTADEISQGWAIACQTVIEGPAKVHVPISRRGRVRPHGHALAEPESLPITCDWHRNPAVRTIRVDLEPPSLADNTSDLDRLQRELARKHGIDQVRAELPILRKLSRVLREADWRVEVTLEMRDWVYGTYLPPRLLAVEPHDTTHGCYGLAVDLGTTSVIAYLVDFETARVVDTASAYNAQISYGDDVISRIIYAQRNGGLERLQEAALITVNRLIKKLCARTHVPCESIHEVAVAGNTTITHLFLGLDPKYLREEPYIPTVSVPPKLIAAELGLAVNSEARVHCLPAVGSYVGGDITAGVISSGLYASEDLTLFIDVGTNGEIVLGTKDWLIACACSAGPAFEGGGVGCGMRATNGAIEDVWVNEHTLEPTFRVIDDAAPLGICGSGLIDLIGELFVTGVLDKSGRIDRSVESPRVRVVADVAEYVLVWGAQSGSGEDIVLTESDVSNLLRAKAAIYAGFSVLCRSVGVELGDVSRILIGGAFGQYINIEKAIRIGLLPDLPLERFSYLGNTSAQGAYTALVCVNMRHEVLDVAGKMTYLELSADNTFMDEYMSALFLPHTNAETFPSVRELLERRALAKKEGKPS